MPDRQELLRLLELRAREYGLLYCLGLLLTADIDVRRELEAISKLPWKGKRSVEVERQRDVVEAEARQVLAEMSSLAQLLEKILENE